MTEKRPAPIRIPQESPGGMVLSDFGGAEDVAREIAGLRSELAAGYRMLEVYSREAAEREGLVRQKVEDRVTDNEANLHKVIEAAEVLRGLLHNMEARIDLLEQCFEALVAQEVELRARQH